MTLAELEWIKERKRQSFPPQPKPEPERKPGPVPAPIDPDTYALDLYGDMISREELPT